MSRAIRAIERWKQPALQIEKKNNLILLLAAYYLFTKDHTLYLSLGTLWPPLTSWTCVILVMFPPNQRHFGEYLWYLWAAGLGIGSGTLAASSMRSWHEHTHQCQHSGRLRQVADPDATSPGGNKHHSGYSEFNQVRNQKQQGIAALPNVIGMITMPMCCSELIWIAGPHVREVRGRCPSFRLLPHIGSQLAVSVLTCSRFPMIKYVEILNLLYLLASLRFPESAHHHFQSSKKAVAFCHSRASEDFTCSLDDRPGMTGWLVT